VAGFLFCLLLFSQRAKPVLRGAPNDGASCVNAARL